MFNQNENKLSRKDIKQLKKDQKEQMKMQEIIDKYGMQDVYSEEDRKNLEIIKSEMFGNDALKMSLTLSGETSESLKASLMSVIVQQNFMIIRALNRIDRKLDADIEEAEDVQAD